jgi:hypothetical protein
VGRGTVHVGDDHRRAVMREASGDCLAYALSAAGDNRNSVL